MIRVVSPHLDDGILSLGQTILGFHDDVEIVTVFAGDPAVVLLTEYDKSCGFASSAEAVERRRSEDSAACFQIGARPRHLTFADRQYQARRDGEEFSRLVAALEGMWTGADGQPEVVCAPLGLTHPDHRFVAEAALEALPVAVAGEPVGLWLYEELPYRVLDPAEAVHRLDGLRAKADKWEVGELPEPWAQGPRGVKAAAIGCYSSQFPEGAEDPCLLVPERSWRVTRRER